MGKYVLDRVQVQVGNKRYVGRIVNRSPVGYLYGLGLPLPYHLLEDMFR